MTVTFYDGSTSLGTGTTNSSGVATYTLSGLSVGSHSITAVVTATDTYDTSTSSASTLTVLDHSYSIAFSQSSYTAVGGSAEISCTLTDNGSAVSGVTVGFTGSDSSLYTGITDSSGVATVTVSVSAETTFTASYSNVSDVCTVTVQTGWFDPCTSSDNLTGYGSYINLRDNTSQSITLGYDSTENAYVLYGANNGGKQNLIPCSYLDGATNFKFEAEVMTKGNSGYYQFGIGVTSTDSKTTSYNYRLRGDSKIQRYNISNGSESESTKVSETIQNKWWKLSMVKDGTTLTTTITDVATDTVKATDTQTITSRNNQRVGLILLAYGATYKGYIRNIKAEAL